MNAMAVPQPDLHPFRHRVPATRGTTRRYISKALAVSALIHLSALAGILWIQAHRAGDDVVLLSGQVHVVPPIGKRLIPPPVAQPPHGFQPRDGVIVPADFVDPVTEQPNVETTAGIQPDGGGETGTQPSPPGGDGSGDVSAVVDGDPAEETFVAFDEPPVPIFRPDPAYPDWARENGIDGRVVLHALVGIDGRVRKVTVIRGIPGLSESATETLYRWTFKPARAGRQAVAVWIEVPFSFRL